MHVSGFRPNMLNIKLKKKKALLGKLIDISEVRKLLDQKNTKLQPLYK